MFEIRQYFLLFLTATIWGTGFIGQKLGITHISPYAFTFGRTLIGALALLPVLFLLKKYKKTETRFNKRSFIVGSICCGFFLILAESFQQFGLVTADVAKTSFITSLYMIFVPIIGIFLGHKLSIKIVLAVIVSVVGLYFFCMKGSFTLEYGDFLVLISAIIFACHVLVISYFVNHVDGVLLSCGQFFVASFFGLIMMLLSDTTPDYESLSLALPALVYVGIMSNGIAYTLQVVGQRGINPTIASLIMSLESVMGAVFGVILLSESLNQREIFGAVLMFAAVILTVLPTSKLNSKKNG